MAWTNLNYNWQNVLNQDLSFKVMLKSLPTSGNLVYEYNPFRNYRLTENRYWYKQKLYTLEELEKEGITLSGEKSSQQWIGVPSTETDPVLLESGELSDFETNELQFDLSHPVNILAQYSYDNSVNLILNDGKNIPRLINSRFSATGKNTYEIVDRQGNNDTNIYDQGSQFDIDTSLYKRVIEIPNLLFYGVYSGGNLKVGNYHFYFKYADADNNETDFVAESGLVSLFIGINPTGIKSGMRDENCYKTVKFYLSNIDSSYSYVHVYYTRETSDIDQNAVTKAARIEKNYIVNNALACDVVITGFENETEIPLSDINVQYNIADAVETQAQCQNRLFLGNVHKPNIPYQELQDLSLRFLPFLYTEEYPLQITKDYEIQSQSRGYYDPSYIYNKVGYWDQELYRLGIVYILPDNSLSPVFNIRGRENLTVNETSDLYNGGIYSNIPLYITDEKTGNDVRNYIAIDEMTNLIIPESSKATNVVNASYENAKGVIQLKDTTDKVSIDTVYGIQIKTEKKVIDELKKYVKGYFFVRQKRIPTTLCEAITIGIDKESNTPLIPTKGGVLERANIDTDDIQYVAERFLNNDKALTHDFLDRIYSEPESKVRIEGAICPEYDIDSPQFNSLFTGDSFTVQPASFAPSESGYFQSLDAINDRHFYIDSYVNNSKNRDNVYSANIIGVEDNTKLVTIGSNLYSARAGEAEEVFRFEYLEKENKTTDATNLVRGVFGPYLGIKGYPYAASVIDIKIPGYSRANLGDYMDIRYNDKSPYYAISDRYAIKNSSQNIQGSIYSINVFRGDCYICQFTHRLNRNFQDPSAPTNDEIVDENTWKDNYDVEKTENLEKINLGDANAIQMGMWVTFKLRSTKNLNIRSIDESNVDEAALTGHPRGFYPYYGMSTSGTFKIPEALVYNKGFENSVSERWNYEVPDSPYIKNKFDTRIMYSDIHINDAFKNGFRVFQLTNYRDYPKTYGSIIKLVELYGNILCVFEHGVALIPINERAVAGQGSGGNVFINTSNVLPENPKMLSDMFGSQWKESVIKTPYYVYGVDTVGKKIWRTNGQQFEIISDFKIQEFLNKNISLTERELDPIIGIRNVKTHYNAFKHDVMFTFYDNLQGFEEKVWNICYNELLQKWITFYSWVPSYSENINNMYFSFDRNTSKWIAKLGVSHSNNDFSDGVTLSNNIIPNNAESGYELGVLSLSNRQLPEGKNITPIIYYTLERDNLQNWKNFCIKYKQYSLEGKNKVYQNEVTLDQILKDGISNFDSFLCLSSPCSDLITELYVREDSNGSKVYPTKPLNLNLSPYKDSRGRIELLDEKTRVNGDSVVILLNIKAHVSIASDSIDDQNIKQYLQGWNNNTYVDAGYYESVVAVIPEYNMQFLTTDFWKHGQAGIIDIADTILPTHWYGKQHPFEFEVVVVDNPSTHKLFDNLQIISNKAVPESFHYEIVGECFDFAGDKKNMYVRQEATKDFYQYNGSNITYNNNLFKVDTKQQKKSISLPLYYSRDDTYNEIEDSYKAMTTPNKNYSNLSGTEVVYYDNLNEFRLWEHSKAVDIQEGRLRGNMNYQEDRWNVQINPIVIVEKNEPAWNNQDENSNTVKPKVPITIGNAPIPNDFVGNQVTIDNVPKDLRENLGYTLRDIDTSDWGIYAVGRDLDGNVIYADAETRKEVKVKDKFVKIRIRYSGKDLAIITALRTLYSLSYA